MRERDRMNRSTRPITPDEQRGFPPPTDRPEWENKA